MGPLAFRTVIELGNQELVNDGEHYPLAAGMQVAGDIQIGRRSVLEYLLSPVQKAFHDAARER
jgi:hemolysin D